MERLADDLLYWSARHDEWHPGQFGAEVGSYALKVGEKTLLFDPLLPTDPGALFAELDAFVSSKVSILITIPYHVRSARDLQKVYGAPIYGHWACTKRLPGDVDFRAVTDGDSLPGGVTALPVGKPRRNETPFHVASARTLVVGDTLVTARGALRVWEMQRQDERRLRWYRERFLPSLAGLLELEVDRVLTTHGPPVLADGTRELRAAMKAPAFYHRG